MQRFAVFLVAALVAVAATVFLVPSDQLAPEGLVALPGSTAALAVVSVLVLVAAACLAAQVSSARCAALALLVAGGILAAAYAGWAALPSAISSFAALVAVVAPPAIVALTLVWPEGHFRGPTERTLALTAWVLVTVASLGWILVWSPYADLMCRLQCGANPLSISPQPELARSLFDVVMVGTGLGCALAVAAGLRTSRFWAGALAALAVGADSVARVLLDPWRSAPTLEGFYTVRTGALGLAGLMIVIECLRRLVRRRRLRRLATTLDAVRPGEYAACLADALRDQTVSIGYLVDNGRAYAQADGRPFDGAGPGQSLTRVIRCGEPVAAIAHRSDVADDVRAGLGPAAELAMDNERLQAELSVRLHTLRESRERIVARADCERVHLERAMHDGAQQVLLMVAHDLSQALLVDSRLEGELRPVIEDVGRVLTETRRIAHGIYPGILEVLGLTAALDALADEGATFTISAGGVARLAPQVERTAYRVVATAVRGARVGSGATSVELLLSANRLAVKVTGGRELTTAEHVDLEDRVGALGGKLDLSNARLVCELPCG